MKTRSFTIPLFVLTIFSMNLISCNALPISPINTLTATATPTLTPTLSPTAILTYPVITDQILQEFSLTVGNVKVVWQDENGQWSLAKKVTGNSSF